MPDLIAMDKIGFKKTALTHGTHLISQVSTQTLEANRIYRERNSAEGNLAR